MQNYTTQTIDNQIVLQSFKLFPFSGENMVVITKLIRGFVKVGCR